MLPRIYVTYSQIKLKSSGLNIFFQNQHNSDRPKKQQNIVKFPSILQF